MGDRVALPKIWDATNRPENIPNIISRLDSFGKNRFPFFNDAIDDGNTSKIQIRQGRKKAAGILIEEVIIRGDPRRRPIEVRSSPHDDDTGEIN